MKAIRTIPQLAQLFLDMATYVAENTDEGSGIDNKIREVLSVVIFSVTGGWQGTSSLPLEAQLREFGWQRFHWTVEADDDGVLVYDLGYSSWTNEIHLDFPNIVIVDYLIPQLKLVDDKFANEIGFGHAGHLIIDAFTGDPAAQRLLNRLVGEQVI